MRFLFPLDQLATGMPNRSHNNLGPWEGTYIEQSSIISWDVTKRLWRPDLAVSPYMGHSWRMKDAQDYATGLSDFRPDWCGVRTLFEVMDLCMKCIEGSLVETVKLG
jgi:hypothetical protein